MPSALLCHWRWLNQPRALSTRAIHANKGKRVLINNPSHWLRKPNPSAAPKLAMAGKHIAHPIAETNAPSEPALPPNCVIYFKRRSTILTLVLIFQDRWITCIGCCSYERFNIGLLIIISNNS